MAHGGVALLWKISLDNYVSPLEDIDSDRIVGIQCDFPGYDTLYILGVDFPSSSLNTEVYDEYFDYMWALYESLSSRGMVLIMGDFNGDLGNSLGDKGKHEPNLCGLKLLDFANYFNLCPVNLMRMCTGPLETFNSCCGRFHSTLDYIFFPDCLLSSIKLAKTFNDDVDNTFDHLPIQLKLCYTGSDSVSTCDGGSREGSKDSRSKLKIHWSKFPSETINRMYKSPLLLDLEKISMSSFTDSAAAVDKITDLLIGNSPPLADTHLKPCKKKNKHAIMSNVRLTLKLLVPNVKLHLILGKTTNILATMKYTTFTIQNVRTIVRVCDVFSIKLKPTKSKNFAMWRALMRNYSGSS